MQRMSGYSHESVKRGLRMLCKENILKMEVERDNGKYVGVDYVLINDLRGK
jgi:hypothetical protein